MAQFVADDFRNRPAMGLALDNLDEEEFEAEIVKVPHHGSGDFDFDGLKAMQPGGCDRVFGRTNFGMIHVHTDGERVLVFIHSSRAGLNEVYRFTVKRRVKFADKVATG